MMLAITIVVCIIVYGLVAGIIHEFFPERIYGFRFDRGARFVWPVFWPVFITVWLAITIAIGPFKFGKWAVRELDERFDFRK